MCSHDIAPLSPIVMILPPTTPDIEDLSHHGRSDHMQQDHHSNPLFSPGTRQACMCLPSIVLNCSITDRVAFLTILAQCKLCLIDFWYCTANFATLGDQTTHDIITTSNFFKHLSNNLLHLVDLICLTCRHYCPYASRPMYADREYKPGCGCA